MSTKGLVSVVIPSRNEPYLQRTCQDLIEKASGPVEVIVILDGYWINPEEVVEGVVYIQNESPKGMRAGINDGVAIAAGEYILKSDAHCMFGHGWDEILKADCEDNWVVVPRRYALRPENWSIDGDNPKYPIDYMYLSKELHGMPWTDKNRDISLEDKKIDDLMSAQGSSWFMKRDYYYFLELLDEEKYGTFFSEFQEIGLKCWLSGGRVVVNKNTWYAHWHKPRDVGRGYSLERGQQEKADAEVNKWINTMPWHKQIYPFTWLIEKFGPVPGWL